MSWKNQLQPGSFRGVPFHVEESQAKLGRRVEVHEYPLQDDPWAEDLGRKAREFTLEVFVVGVNYHQVRDQLINAIDQKGPGTLIHPRLGSMRVQMTENCRWRESTREGGMAEFTLAYVEAGERQFPATQADTVTNVQTAVNSGLTALQTDVSKQFSVAGRPQFVFDDALNGARTGLGVIRSAVSAVNAFKRDDVLGLIDALSLSLPTQLADIWQLSGEVINTQREVFALLAKDTHTTPAAVTSHSAVTVSTRKNSDALVVPVSLSDRISDSFAELPAVPVPTPSRQQQADNRQALARLYTVSASLLSVQTVVELSEAIGVESNEQSPFDSYDHAIAVRDQLMSNLDTIADTASDNLYTAIRDLQAELLRHIDAHGFKLERIRYHHPMAELPSLVLAHNLYGDATRSADIVRRNRVRHPGFVQAGTDLEVLDG